NGDPNSLWPFYLAAGQFSQSCLRRDQERLVSLNSALCNIELRDREPAEFPIPRPASATKAPTAELEELQITSPPAGAHIEIDGDFVRSTSSTTGLAGSTRVLPSIFLEPVRTTW